MSTAQFGASSTIILKLKKKKRTFISTRFYLKFKYPERKASVDKISSLSAASSKCPTAFLARGLASKTFVNNSRTISAC